ncbi:MAG: TolC family protein [bacterium]|jgi:outer membrane protein TolC|nr:TolC family protein [bacterium]
MKCLLILIPIITILVLSSLQSSWADTYREAKRVWRQEKRPWFLEESGPTTLVPIQAGPPQPTTGAWESWESKTEAEPPSLDLLLQESYPHLVARMQTLQPELVQKPVESIVGAGVDETTFVSLVLLRNPGVRAALDTWQASRNRYAQGAYLEGILRQYNAFTKTLDLLTGEMQKQRPMLEPQVPFPGSTSLRGDLIQTDVHLAKTEAAMVVQDQIAEARNAFHESIYTKKILTITQEQRELLHQMLEVITRRYEAGSASYNDLLQTRIALARLDNELQTWAAQRGVSQARLNTMLDCDPTAPIGSLRSSALQWPAAGLDTLSSQSLAVNPAIQKARLMVTRTQQMIAMAKAMNRPEPTLGASYFQDRSALLVGAEPVRPAFNPAPRLPLNTGFGDQEAFLAEMGDRQSAQTQTLQQVINQIQLAVKTAWTAADTAFREIHLYQSTVLPDVTQRIHVAEQEFEAARIDYIDYLDSQNDWLVSRQALARAEQEVGQRLADLDRAVGTCITKTQNPQN